MSIEELLIVNEINNPIPLTEKKVSWNKKQGSDFPGVYIIWWISSIDDFWNRITKYVD